MLCRLYHKKNEWEKMQQRKEEEDKEVDSFGDTRTPESEIDDAVQLPPLGDVILPKEELQDLDGLGGADDWLTGINLDDLPMPADDFYSSMLMTPTAFKTEQGGFFF